LSKRSKYGPRLAKSGSKTVLVGGVGSSAPVSVPPNHEPGWEYLYLATELESGIHQLDDEYARYMSGQVVPTGVTVSDPIRDAVARCDDAKEIVDKVNQYFAPKLLEKAFGPKGVAGDESTIRFVADGIVGVYRSCLEWGEQIRGTEVPVQWQPLYSALADMVTLPMQQIEEFTNSFLTSVRASVEGVRAGEVTGRVLDFTLRISIDPRVSQRFEESLEALRSSS